MPSISQIAGGASLPLSVGMALMKVPTPYTIAAGAALGLIGMVDKIGEGRKTANKMTANGGPQDIINKQLTAIANSNGSADEKAQATDYAWRGFMTAANQFAATQGPRAAQVVQQALYKTPALTQTVQKLMGGRDPLGDEYTSLAPGITATSKVNTGSVPWGQIAQVGASVAAPLAINKIQSGSWMGGAPSTASPPGGASTPGGSPDWQGPLDQSNPQSGSTGPANPANPTQPSPGGSLFSRLFPQLVSAGTSLIGGTIASHAASQAANVQANASDKAAQTIAASGKYATDAQTANLKDILGFNKDVLAQQQQNLQPWLTAGTGALQKIQDITNDPAFSWTQTFKAPTQEEAMKDPGIQFQLDQGNKAILAYERATGKSLSGGAVKDINQFSQGVASTGYNDVFNRDLRAYDTNYGTFGSERAAKLNPQLSIAGLGQVGTGEANAALSNAATANASASTNAATNIGNIATGTARGIADASTSAAAARASGYVGSANSLGNAIGQIGNNFMSTQQIQQILQMLQQRPASA